MKMQQFVRWGSQSFFRHILLFQVFVSAPSLLLFTLGNYLEGSLTVKWAFWILLVTVLEGVIISVPVWFLIAAPKLTDQSGRGRYKNGSKTDRRSAGQ